MSTPKFTSPRPLNGLIGHRGVAALAPENTMASFNLAAEQGISWIEFDVRLTKDNALIIFHDDTLERTTTGTGWVHETPLKELKRLNAGSWFSPEFAFETIPVFEEALPELIDLVLYLNIELKTPPNASFEHIQILAEKTAKIIETYWPSHLPLPLVSSFEWRLLDIIRGFLQAIPIGFLTEVPTPEIIQKVADTSNAALHVNYEHLSADLIALANTQQVPLLAYTVNDRDIAAKLLKDGVFGVFSDNPGAFLK